MILNESIRVWLLYFFLYSFAGWIWESSYVSAKEKKFVNRGFIKGPFLPLYGSGALVLIFASIPVKDSPVLVFLSGMVCATILEYITGASMEALFKVRYWDYRNRRFNLNGHICLQASLLWGFFALIVTRYLHPCVTEQIARIPESIQNVILIFCSGEFCIDYVISFYHAMKLRFILEKLAEAREELIEAAGKMEDALRENIAAAKTSAADKLESGVGMLTAAKNTAADKLESGVEMLTAAKNTAADKLGSGKEQFLEEFSEKRRQLMEFYASYQKRERKESPGKFASAVRALNLMVEKFGEMLPENGISLTAFGESISKLKEKTRSVLALTTRKHRDIFRNYSEINSSRYSVELELLKNYFKKEKSGNEQEEGRKEQK